ncbi:uncharacterized protein [Halyomorpha halys]|uniref:uncharacterized protein n=1 Tax=Halyomorpha halys TaxID=286706 RepID=UPI0006D4E108|nr:uncharacterized protein LOC106685488 [Halyomorpha halys]
MKTSTVTAVTKFGNKTVSISDEPTPVNNQTQLADSGSTPAPGNDTLQAAKNPIDIVIKRPDISKYIINGTNRPLIPIGIGRIKNSVSKSEKTSGKGRKKRAPPLVAAPASYNYLIRTHPAPPPLLDYYYPSSKEIPQVKGDELSLLMRGMDSFLDIDPFDEDFDDIAKPITKPLFKSKEKNKLVPVSFMDSFFSSEDFPSPSSDYSDSESKEKSPEQSGEDDVYDIHGYRDPSEDERSVKPKPPAYNLAVSKNHDYTPVRGTTHKPVTFKPTEKPRLVETFKIKEIHQFPGYALPGSSTEASAEKRPEMRPEKQPEKSKEEESSEEEEEEHHHHHFYDQLKHVHHNPPKGFDPESFRLTIPSIIKHKYPNMYSKKHKHFHHIEDAPIIIKYSKKKKEKGSKKKKRPLTESEEEANYDEEGELSEKEIENAYKNYDDSQINQDITHDYEVDESAEETKIREVKEKLDAAKLPVIMNKNNNKAMFDLDSLSNIVFNTTSGRPKFKMPKNFKNFWKLHYKFL